MTINSNPYELQLNTDRMLSGKWNILFYQMYVVFGGRQLILINCIFFHAAEIYLFCGLVRRLGYLFTSSAMWATFIKQPNFVTYYHSNHKVSKISNNHLWPAKHPPTSLHLGHMVVDAKYFAINHNEQRTLINICLTYFRLSYVRITCH